MNKKWIPILLDAVYHASEKIMTVYHGNFEVELKDDRSPVTLADKLSSRVITEKLMKTGIPVLSEEENKPAFEKRKHYDRIWLVDPLDGTKEFIRRNDEFCINIALVEKGEPVFGMIANPITRHIIFGGLSTGAFYIPYQAKKYMDEEFRLRKISNRKQKGLVYSRSHFTPGVSKLIIELEKMYGPLEVIKKGSALKFFDLVLGKAHFYPRMAPTMEWDIAAGDAIYRAVGGEVVDFTNFETLKYNKANLVNPNFIARPVALSLNTKTNE
jgi:3'(2'), 5'-bisphosphate nucleotidase